MKRNRDEAVGDDKDTGGKLFCLDPEQFQRQQLDTGLICTLPPSCSANPHRFESNELFEQHYYRNHCSKCLECQLAFPSEHILHLHIIEVHDSFAAARKARGEKIYGCFEEGCDRACSEPHKRKRHMIDKHGYPPTFYFDIVKKGVNANQMSRLRKHRNN